MSAQQPHSTRAIARQIRTILARQFKVKDDQASYAEIDSNIRSMVVLKGTGLWVLMFAIIIASIGLNVNSTAAIIGAMLISPLMGPIIGIGYGVGINDIDLIKQSFRSIGMAVLLSLSSATLYFLMSPLSEASSELLARTTPTIWDVLIAFFGGMAGILATTRREKSNVIPGVAIATALMPPLCTAGYGLASGHWAYFFGALYLFFINLVFIFLATVMFVGYIKLPHKKLVDEDTERRVRKYITVLVLITVVPSIYLAYNMVTDIAFKSRARDFIRNEMTFDKTVVTQEHIAAKTHEIDVTLVGDTISKEEIASIEKHLRNYGLDNAKLVMHQATERKIDIASLRTSLLSELYSASVKTNEEKDKRIQSLETELAKVKADQADGQSIARELRTQYPMLVGFALAKTPIWKADGSAAGETSLISYLAVSRPVSLAEQRKIIAWLKVRTKTENVKLIVSTSY
jgi:uncharacterized hydrophobic protein (TIGR00271 family)